MHEAHNAAGLFNVAVAKLEGYNTVQRRLAWLSNRSQQVASKRTFPPDTFPL